MNMNALRSLLAEVLEQDAIKQRTRDALADRLHSKFDEIPEGEALDAGVLLDEEIDRAAAEIGDYLGTLAEVRAAKALHAALAAQYDPARRSEFDFALRHELERSDNHIRELSAVLRDKESPARPTLNRLAILVIVRNRLSGD